MEASLFVLPDEQTNDDIPIPPEQGTAEINNQSDIWYRVGDTVYFNNSEFEIINITDNENEVTLRNTSGDLFNYNRETFYALLYTNNRNRELRSERIKSINEIPAGTELLGSNSVWQEYQALERQHIDKIILYQIGDFYEVMGSDAGVVAKTLEINLTSRDVGLPESVPMCGFPDFRLDDYVEKLADNGFSVAVRHTDGTVILNEIEQPEIPEESGYILTYRFINDRLLVSNEFNYDPDDPDTFLPPNVARVEPDHSIVWLDENLPEVERLEIRRVAETEFDRYKEQAEARGQAMFDFALAVAEKYDLSLETPPESEQFSLFDLPDEFTPVEPETVDIPDNIKTEPQHPQISAVNFRITDDHIGEGGAKTKYGYNVTAIQILQAIEAENRHAMPDEQEILSRYVGWGGLPQAFDPNNKQWEREYAELKRLLPPDEYDMARASTLNAHYTSPVVIKAMYETLERLGFKDGNILEPACGVGNFFGLLPDIMQKSKLYGVELDSITGRIAQQLYPNADIKIMGFEKTTMPDAFFDVAIGNVPFGSYKLSDPKYNKNDFLIHDYFFGKALDQVRPGGIVAFITSKGTLDKANPEVRKYIAQRAELLGAVRLPNDAFQKNAGTEVTSDIIFLQKRDRLIDIQPEWVHLGQTENGVPVNSYFADNPHMMLGTMAFDDRMYGNNSETTLNPIEGADLAEQLKTALSHIHGKITEVELDDLDDEMAVRDSVPANPNVRNFSYTMIDNDVYFRENSRMCPVDLPAATLERVKGMVALRDITHKLIDYQLNDYPDEYIKTAQNNLNRLYDDFTQKYGLINSNANNKAFSSDSAYYLLCSLEILNENNELARKSDMFTKRTIKQKSVVTSVDTSTEALAVSIAQKARVDIDLMAELTGFTPEKVTSDLQGIIFHNPQTMKYESADEYLSGNVREKLSIARTAAENNPDYIVNVKALEQVQPKDLD
ncbi:MAG: hypothetical protein FWD71_22415, partial [Oscillospiraceae bacterium]|nr:hypothetical protein [Oscillospiraceae bacterium]